MAQGAANRFHFGAPSRREHVDAACGALRTPVRARRRTVPRVSTVPSCPNHTQAIAKPPTAPLARTMVDLIPSPSPPWPWTRGWPPLLSPAYKRPTSSPLARQHPLLPPGTPLLGLVAGWRNSAPFRPRMSPSVHGPRRAPYRAILRLNRWGSSPSSPLPPRQNIFQFGAPWPRSRPEPPAASPRSTAPVAAPCALPVPVTSITGGGATGRYSPSPGGRWRALGWRRRPAAAKPARAASGTLPCVFDAEEKDAASVAP